MQEELLFLPNKATCSNLTELSKSVSRSYERRICELYDIAKSAADFYSEALDFGLSPSEILSLISQEISFGSLAVHERALTENAKRLESVLFTLSKEDKLLFTDLFFTEIEKLADTFAENDLLPYSSYSNKFIYVKNAFADEAYDVFSEGLEDAVVEYARDFRECIRAVIDGNRDFCLLPLEERGGERIANVLELIYSYDLKIVAVTSVFGPDGSQDLKYAMVARSFLNREYNPEDDRYLEIRLERDGGELLSEALSAAEFFGCRIYRVNTVSLSDTEGERAFYSVVFHSENSFLRLLTYFTLFRADFLPIGIYANLE